MLRTEIAAVFGRRVCLSVWGRDAYPDAARSDTLAELRNLRQHRTPICISDRVHVLILKGQNSLADTCRNGVRGNTAMVFRHGNAKRD